MRQRTRLTSIVNKDVCIFCATRLQNESFQAVTTVHRRFFRSSVASQRPPAEAVARSEDEHYNDARTTWQSGPPPKQSTSGWASTSAVGDLTPEEQDLRNALQAFPQPGRAPQSQRAPPHHGRSAAPHKGRRFPSKNREGGRQVQAEKGPPVYTGSDERGLKKNVASCVSWKCPSCTYHNLSTYNPFSKKISSNPNCRKCGTARNSAYEKSHPRRTKSVERTFRGQDDKPVQDFQNEGEETLQLNTDADEEALRVEGWKHVRRRRPDAAKEREPQDPCGDSEQAGELAPTLKFTKREHNFFQPKTVRRMKAIEAESERTARLERAKDGHFVGFREYPSFNTSEGEDLTPMRKVVQKENKGQHLAEWEYPLGIKATPEDFSQSKSQEYTTQSEGHAAQSPRTRSDLSFDPEFQEDSTPQHSDRSVGSRMRDPGFRPTTSGVETYVPRDREKGRRSRGFVSSYDDMGEDDDLHTEKRLERKKRREMAKEAKKAAAPPTAIYLPGFISVSNLAGVLKVRLEDFVSKMEDLGFEETNSDHVLDSETAGLIAAEFNFEPIVDQTEETDLLSNPPAEDKSVLPPRPPVVTIMGHVDHGKTTLLDYLRKSSVAASEHGGITQHIGAFSVPMPGGRLVTFLDTPGHEAFLSMRQRGANVTDIIILVVAADDSVKPQTVEAIKHAQAAKVPMIVAVNKIDKEDSNVDRVKQDLARYSVEIEDYGGDTQVVCVSGKTGQGMEELEDATVALADILDMRAETDGQAEGWVLEATTKKAGRVATVLVRRGTLRSGDVIVAGTSWARVRSLRNEAGAMIRAAGPGTPVEIDGWREQPSAGDEVIQAPDEQKAKSVIAYRLEISERTKLAADTEAVNEARRQEQQKREELARAAELAAENPDAASEAEAEPTSTIPTLQEVFFVVKADVSGSAEVVTNSISALGNSEVRPHILRSGFGPITEFDIDHAAVAKGHIINFNTTIEGQIQRIAENKGVEIIDQSIIYRLVDDVKAKLSARLPPAVTQRVLGEAEIAQVFEINTKARVKVPVAGCKVRNGVIARGSKMRVMRDKEIVFDGSLSSLKNVKKDATEMRKGNECGMGFEGWTEFKVGDQVQAYEELIEKRTL